MNEHDDRSVTDGGASDRAANNPVRELRTRAELLQRDLARDAATALPRLRALPELRRADDHALRAFAAAAQRKHCLAVVARECGFGSWEHAVRVLEGDPDERDLGTLLHTPSGTLNAWFTEHEEARGALAAGAADGEPRFLLGFRRELFVTGPAYVESLGLDPRDPDWRAMGWDWARPLDPTARTRLFGKLLAARRSG